MLNKKAILILFLLIIGILTMTSVSASDAAGDIVANASAEEIGINEENINDLSTKDVENTEIESDEVLNVADSGTFTALYNKLYNAKEGSTITLENDYTYNPTTDENTIPLIRTSLTINGNGHSINGNSQSALLQVLGHNNVVLNDIKFTNGYANEVVRVDYAKSIKIYNCEFTGNTGYFGGALVVTDTDYMEMNKTIFANNNGYLGGAIFSNNTQNAFLFESDFASNYAIYGGALLFQNFNQTYFGGCMFAENYANRTGGAIYLEGGNWGVITSCGFSKNIAEFGGAISSLSMRKLDIYISYFNRNQASYGGAIKIQSTDDIYLAGDKFDNNHAFWGGAINVMDGSCVINTCSLISNYADGEGSFGGGIYARENSYLHIYNTDFSKNSAYYAGGLFIYNSNYGIVEKCNFTSNKGDYIGGCYLYGSDAAFSECQFKKNTASEDTGVGGIASSGGTYGAVLVDATFSGNTPRTAVDVVILYTVKLKIRQTGSTCDDKVIVVTVSRRLDNTPLPDREVKLNINGKTVKIKTNSKGQAIYKANLPAKSYVATAKHEGSGQYNTNSTKAKVTIKKATPKIVAAKKTFKVKAKVKSYTITMKNSVGKIMKNTNVKLTVKGKTFSARTNAKGQATFKINNLNGRGSFPATIKFAGNGYYNPVSKKVAIAVI